ncbi:MAG: hypothetical protein NVSMB33_07390 [Ktedonobacteraceae bacterium]
MSDLEGIMLSDYLLLQCISKGGVADVYRACQHRDGNYEVAVKVFRSGYAQQQSFHDYFMAEAEKIGQFDHPNILPFLEFGEGEGLLYVVTPFMTAGTLEDLLTRVGSRFSAMQALPIMQQLCSAVQYSHDHDVIHGNIKPRNVFKGADGRMLLTDFGIAHGYDDSQQSLTRVGWGSAEYAAPEQSLGVLRRASDVYALGVLLFRMLTGQPPFIGQTPVEVLLKHVRQPVPSARSLVPAISDAVDRVLHVAMQKRSDDRFASVAELSNAFLAAVTLAPVASPVAKFTSILTTEPIFEPLQSVSNPQTPVPVLNSAFTEREVRTSAPAPFSYSTTTRPLGEPLPSFPSAENAVSDSPGLDVAEMHETNFLRNDVREDKHIFWSVDPVEWSPVTNVQGNAEPLTANAYLQSKSMVEQVCPTAAEAASSVLASAVSAKTESSQGNRFSKRLSKLLPIIVVILLLLGLLAALLSSFFYSSDGHSAYVPSPYATHQHVVVYYEEGSDG